ncbi:MAG: hypothetical protein ACI9Y7_001263 [Dokdonia sp.]|jgi:hypothetical protein
MGIKGKFCIPYPIILMIVIGCSSSQLPEKYVDKNKVFSTYKVSNNPDKEAFHLNITLFEEDSTPSRRRIGLRSLLRPVSRYKTEEGYTSMILTYPSILPQLMPRENGQLELDYLEEDTLKLSVWGSNLEIHPILMKLGKSLEVVLYLNSADDY